MVFHILLVLSPAAHLYSRQPQCFVLFWFFFFLVTGPTFIELFHCALVTASVPKRIFLPDEEYCSVFAPSVAQRRNNSFLSVFCNQAFAAAWINLLPCLRTLVPLAFSVSLVSKEHD